MTISSFVRYPTVKEVIDLRNAKAIPASEFIAGLDERGIHQTRLEIDSHNHQNDPVVICACCHTPVKLRSSYRHNHYFKHNESPRVPCQYQDGGGLDAKTLDSCRYNGLKESYRHRRMKDLIENCLRADPSFQVEERAQERVWQSSEDPGVFRRPDVRATLKQQDRDLRIAFEVQLSSTYLHVIAERRLFYLKDNALIFWVFDEYQGVYPSCYEKDLFYNNNSNLFIVDEETHQLSCDNGIFMLRCRYLVPRSNNDKIEEDWTERVIAFSDLTIETDKQRVWYFDSEGELLKAKEECRRWEELARLEREKSLREYFEVYWVGKDRRSKEDNDSMYRQIRLQFAHEGISLPQEYDGRSAVVLNILYSAKQGRVVGYGHKKLVEIAHKTVQSYPEYIRYFAAVVTASGTKRVLREEDKSGKWAERAKGVWNKMELNDPLMAPDMKFVNIIKLLFPCCEEIIKKYAV